MLPTLKLGDHGDSVRALQTKLNSFGLAVVVDGDFGANTDAAVRKLQTDHQLAAVDGVVGPKTWQILNATLEAAPAPIVQPKVTTAPAFVDGYYVNARKCPANAARVGDTITACGTVVHTTDCGRGTMARILQRWSEEKGEGCAANFMIGRRAPTTSELLSEKWPSAGLVQMVPIDRNANHAGGSRKINGQWLPYHGFYQRADGSLIHPNSCTVGIEIDCAGRLTVSHGVYYHADSGQSFTADEVYIDERGKPWHLVTDYQLEQLGILLDALEVQLAHFPDGVTVKPNGSYEGNGAQSAIVKGVRIVGHYTLDPNNKTDPGPQVIAFLRTRYGI